MTGNFYCIPSSCAKVVYREYLPPVVRWRYEGENWQEIVGADDYQLQQDWYGGQNPNIAYRYKYGRAAISGGTLVGWSIFYADQPAQVVLPIQNVRLIIGSTDYGVYEHWAFKWAGSGNPPPDGSRSRRYLVEVFDATNQWKLWLNTISTGHQVIGLEPADGSTEENPGGGNCTFRVFKDGVVVHEETRAECPEVEQFDCRLSDEIKQIEIQKLPFLERVEIVDYGYLGFGLNEFSYSLPEESLNIYRNNITAAIPPFNQLQSGFFTSHEFIAQISSASDCPPPQYTVICDCDSCESCPDDTCPVECDGQICCYDTTTGKAVRSIPIDNYCGG